MTHKINTDHKVAVSTNVFWLPITPYTPRNVKVLVINKEASGVAQQAEVREFETWWTHWHPLPKFID